MDPTDTITVSSRYTVLHFREVLEAILRGQVVIVTHYGRPKAAFVPFELWERVRPAAEPSPDPATAR